VPAGVDAALREQFLSNAAFRALVGMRKTEYAGKPVWKRTQLKKSAQLF
jgi:hypothetical protein